MDCLPRSYKLHLAANDLLLDHDLLDRFLLGSSSHPIVNLSAHGHTPTVVQALRFEANEVHPNVKRSHVHLCLVHVLLFQRLQRGSYDT